ncbi:hypothetical protein ACFVGY_35875 [Streptomyces sp. NPDC127106]|uniref:hypothetical protein n=1 Tax=Streptomyces sp. NPDC127106 TaxID=3345360 RepID=UPI00362E754A
MPGSASRLVAPSLALLIALTPAAAAAARPSAAARTPGPARPTGTADGPADVALAVGLTGAAAFATGLWLRSRYRRDAASDTGGRAEGGDP